MKAYAVIGMNYGDEGKGHIVNFLSDENTLVVRYNGGAQAAHTTELSDGRKHVFRHFGSGTLKGARTLLGKHFIVNPLAFVKELEILMKIHPSIKEVLIDPTCRVTTPYDMMINEYNSKRRGANDTCGMGINETVERSMFRDLRIVARDLLDKSDEQLLKILKVIENEYIPHRLEELKIEKKDFKEYAKDKIFSDDMETSFIKCSRWVAENSAVWSEDQVVDRYLNKAPGRKVIFEGAQGMLLDQYRKEFFPYLTRSTTGIRNASRLLSKLKTPIQLEVNLVSRVYLSRHGDGPLWNKVDGVPYKKVNDPTNPENPYQGKIRYGYLNTEWPKQAFKETEERLKKDGISHYTIQTAATCIDQLDAWNEEYPLDSEVKAGLGKMEPVFLPLKSVLPNIGIISTGRNESNIKRIDK